LQLHPRIQTGEIQPSRNVGLLFVEFLEYYGKHFNYDEAGISLRGRGGYFNKHDKGWFRPNQPYLLSIEDPNDPCTPPSLRPIHVGFSHSLRAANDVSGGSHNIIRVRQTLAGAFDVLSATLCHRASHFEARRNPDFVPLSGDALPNADADARSPLSQSILGSIVGMSRAAVIAREDNVGLHGEGVLQQLLESSLGSKKAAKKLKQVAKKATQREKTISRLETRQEKKRMKKERKKQAAAEQAALMSKQQSRANTPDVADSEEEGEVVDSQGTNNTVLLDPASDPSSSSSSQVGEDPPVARRLFESQEADDSRYSIGSPAAARTNGRFENVVYVHGTSSGEEEVSSDEGEFTIGGGNGGDTIRSKAKSNGREATKSKKAERNAFWSAKGPREEIVLDDDDDDDEIKIYD
jgi:non-canonical poly(A) RNA polymerase PAPD5/7